MKKYSWKDFLKSKACAFCHTAASQGLAVWLAMAVLVSAGLQEEEALGKPRSSYGLGSAGYLKETNLLYSLYVDTPESQWTDTDKEQTLSSLLLAADYIEEQAVEYGCETQLICDWQENPELTGNATVDFAISDEEDFVDRLDEEIALWVKEKVDFSGLKKSCNAKGIALLVFVNNPGTSYAIVFDGVDNPKESLILFREEPPSVYAHEILHLFGAHDLYRDAEYTREVTDFVGTTYPLEIMFTVAGEKGVTYTDKIVNEVSPITAYHLGWINDAEEIELFPQLKRR